MDVINYSDGVMFGAFGKGHAYVATTIVSYKILDFITIS